MFFHVLLLPLPVSDPQNPAFSYIYSKQKHKEFVRNAHKRLKRQRSMNRHTVSLHILQTKHKSKFFNKSIMSYMGWVFGLITNQYRSKRGSQQLHKRLKQTQEVIKTSSRRINLQTSVRSLNTRKSTDR